MYYFDPTELAAVLAGPPKILDDQWFDPVVPVKAPAVFKFADIIENMKLMKKLTLQKNKTEKKEKSLEKTSSEP